MKFLENMFVSKEIAEKLKEIGFDEKCIAKYQFIETNSIEMFYRLELLTFPRKSNLPAPTYEQVFKWFRDKGINAVISYHNSEKYGEEYDAIIYDNKDWRFNPRLSCRAVRPHEYSMKDAIYEEIREALILEMIEIYKNNI